jgi:hypothetical protein
MAEKFFVNIEEHMEASPEMITAGDTPDFALSKITLSILASNTYSVTYNVVPRYEIAQGLDLETELEKAVERVNEIDFSTLKFNTTIENESI